MSQTTFIDSAGQTILTWYPVVNGPAAPVVEVGSPIPGDTPNPQLLVSSWVLVAEPLPIYARNLQSEIRLEVGDHAKCAMGLSLTVNTASASVPQIVGPCEIKGRDGCKWHLQRQSIVANTSVGPSRGSNRLVPRYHANSQINTSIPVAIGVSMEGHQDAKYWFKVETPATPATVLEVWSSRGAPPGSMKKHRWFLIDISRLTKGVILPQWPRAIEYIEVFPGEKASWAPGINCGLGAHHNAPEVTGPCFIMAPIAHLWFFAESG